MAIQNIGDFFEDDDRSVCDVYYNDGHTYYGCDMVIPSAAPPCFAYVREGALVITHMRNLKKVVVYKREDE